MNVLVVDDEPIIVKGIVAHIKKMENFSGQVVGANSGKEAMQIMEYFKPHLVITDISMPGINGLTLLSHIQQNSLCDYCIILTAFENFDYARQAIQNRVIDYILKPINWPELEVHIRNRMNQLMGGDRFESAMKDYAAVFADLHPQDCSYMMGRLLDYIERNYAHDISLTQLGEHVAMSTGSICNLFKRELGTTYMDYLHKIRTYEACRLILSGKAISIHTVATRIGYKTDRQFFRVFKELMGLTPLQFEKKYLQ